MNLKTKPRQIGANLLKNNNLIIEETYQFVNTLLASISRNNCLSICYEDRCKLYSSYKQKLSFICGWDATSESYNQELFQQAERKIRLLLRI
jgi:hypothetical protein